MGGEIDFPKLLEEYTKAQAQKEPCPSCGHCPTCGRGGHQAHPWAIPMPYYPTYPYQPYWGPTWISNGTYTIS